MQIVKNSLIYLTASILNKSIPLLLLPIFTKYLSPSEFGLLSIFQLLLTFYSALVGMAIHTNISKNFFKYDRASMAKLIGNIIFILCFAALSVSVVTLFIIYSGNTFFSMPVYWIQIMPMLSLLLMINTLNLTVLRNEGNAKLFGIFEISNTLVNTITAIAMLLIYNMGWESQVIGITFSYLVFFAISLSHMYRRKYLLFKFDLNEIKSILKLSLPLIPHVMGGTIIALSDRIFIEQMVGLSEVGIYSVGYMFGMIVMLFTDAFVKAWTPWFFKSIVEPTEAMKKKIVRYSYYYIFFIFILAVVISQIAENILPFFVNEKYYSAKKFIIWISLGYAIQGIYKIFLPYLIHLNKTSFLATSTVLAAIVNLVLNYFLIREYGSMGAAYATIIAFAFSATLLFWYQNRGYPMPWFNFQASVK